MLLRVISQTQVNEFLFQCLNIDPPPGIISSREIVMCPNDFIGHKVQICDGGHTPARNRSLSAAISIMSYLRALVSRVLNGRPKNWPLTSSRHRRTIMYFSLFVFEMVHLENMERERENSLRS